MYRNAFKNELTLMQKVRHPNVIQFVGAVTQNIPMMIVYEYLPKVSCCREPIPHRHRIPKAILKARLCRCILLIEECWNPQPGVRPTFSEIILRLDKMYANCPKPGRWKENFKLPWYV
ncbi:hypothetical protein GW17_00013410 [Ensete ventricosum]|nr:hypothetical protein GW17_00013410 [Ensete ventricosum]